MGKRSKSRLSPPAAAKGEQASSSTPAPLTSEPAALAADKAKAFEESRGEKSRRTWGTFLVAMRDEIVLRGFQLLILSPLLLLLSPVVYIPCYRASLQDAEFTIDRRERVTKGSGDGQQSYYLVWSREGEVFCVTDTWSFMSFDSSDRYGQLREGSHVKAQVAGWRVPFLSWYRNIVEIQSVEP